MKSSNILRTSCIAHCKSYIPLLTVFIALMFLSSCGTLDVYEKSVIFNKHEWKNTDKPSFTFSIQDTTAYYNIFVVLRHDDAYHYNNLWLNVTTKAPKDTAVNQQLELTLANNTKGWLGTGIDDVFDHRVRITSAPVKLKKGDYQFTLQQIMREETLPYVLSAGIRVEKAPL